VDDSPWRFVCRIVACRPKGGTSMAIFYSVVEDDPLDSSGTSGVIEGWPSCTIQGDDGRVPGNAKIKNKLRYALLLSLTLIAGCDAFSSQPTYGGLSIEGFNYTPYNLDRFVITDQYGNKAGGGGDLMPGSGEGSLSCCYTLKGTDFTVDWYVVDQDEFMKDPYGPLPVVHKVSRVHFPMNHLQADFKRAGR
jgi:hypothetical protein